MLHASWRVLSEDFPEPCTEAGQDRFAIRQEVLMFFNLASFSWSFGCTCSQSSSRFDCPCLILQVVWGAVRKPLLTWIPGMRKLNMWKKHTEGGMNHDQANPKPRIMSGILHEKAELELERGNVASQLSAASSLLRLTCDAVIELDNDLRMTEDSPELAYMLMTLGVVVEQSASSSLVHASSRILSRSHAAESYPSCVDIFEDPPAFLISDCTPCALHRAIHARNPTKNSNRNTNSKPINPAHTA